MSKEKLVQDLDYVETWLIHMRESPYNDLRYNQLITSMLEIEYDILTELIQMRRKENKI